MSLLEMECDRISKLVAELEQRIQPILRVNEPVCSGESSTNLEEALCSMAENIRFRRHSVEISANHLSSILNRIEL